MLTQAGAHVLHAASGQEALDVVDRQGLDIDLVLMDVQMPGMDGLSTTRELLRRMPDLPVLGLTAFAMEDERLRARVAGMVGQVDKPVDRNVLLRAVERHARRSNSCG